MTPVDVDPKALLTVDVLILRELYELKMLLIEAIGRDKYKSIDLDKVVQYVQKSAAQIPPAGA